MLMQGGSNNDDDDGNYYDSVVGGTSCTIWLVVRYGMVPTILVWYGMVWYQ